MSNVEIQKDALILLNQIKYIVQNKPIPDDLRCNSDELSDIQEAIVYIANCFFESNNFLNDISKGNLNGSTPGKHNFLAGTLKELHAGLRHLSWQANQVANGDYKQKVVFLGDFSESFNKMVEQLSEREHKLVEQTEILAESNNLMKAIMDGLKDWIIVTIKSTGEIAYANKSAGQRFFSLETNTFTCKKKCGKPNCSFLDSLKLSESSNNIQGTVEIKCEGREKVFGTRTFSIQWNNQPAYAHYITDVTFEKQYQEQIEAMAFKDELTELYNRRFCIQEMEELLDSDRQFSLCLLDLDGLKFVNDNFGHGVGDEYLKIFSEELGSITRPTDILCRIGGDEFIILFPACPSEMVQAKMEKLNEKLNQYEVDYKMSASYGVVNVDSNLQMSTEEVLTLADKKMYKYKKKFKQERV